jgi:GntR family transcriptional regulator
LLQRSPIPLYHQLKELLIEKIESGEWEPGHQLPTEFQLTLEFGVSRATVRQAMQLLENQGLIDRKQGRGTFVARPKIAHDLASRRRFWSTPRFRLLSLDKRTAPASVAEQLGLAVNDQVWEMQRIILEGDEPLMLIRSWYPVALFPGLDTRDAGTQAMSNILGEGYGVYSAREHREVEVTTLDEEEARLLDASVGMPALLLTYLSLTSTGQGIEYRKMIVRGDRSKYYVDIELPEMLL